MIITTSKDLMSTLKDEETDAINTILKFMESPISIRKNKYEIERLLCSIDPKDEDNQKFLAEINRLME